MRVWITFLTLLISELTLAQGFVSNRIAPILSSHTEYAKTLPISKNVSISDCPPKLTHQYSAHFTFLDSLPLTPQFEEELLTQFMSNKCEEYYSSLFLYLNSKPIYDSILSANGVDIKYAILPLILSGCNPTLKYHADKSGEWQLSYVNARKYGLYISQYEDERNSTILSTIAAANYLKFLNNYYLNNELLVITAFYTSVPFVNKKVNQLDTVNALSFYQSMDAQMKGNFSYLKSWIDWTEHFKIPENINYKNLNSNWKIVNVSDTLNFETISKFIDLSIKEIENINPVLTGKKVLPNAKTAFYLPSKNAAEFETKYNQFIIYQKEEEIRKKEALEKLRKQLESGIPDLTKFKAVIYSVKSGDVLGKIASTNKVKVSQIKQWNNLKSDRIDINQKLTLYVPKNSSVQLPRETADNKINSKPTLPVPGKGTPIIYVVKNGESLWLISQKYPGVSAENIMEWNGCTERIKPGMELKIYTPTN